MSVLTLTDLWPVSLGTSTFCLCTYHDRSFPGSPWYKYLYSTSVPTVSANCALVDLSLVSVLVNVYLGSYHDMVLPDIPW